MTTQWFAARITVAVLLFAGCGPLPHADTTPAVCKIERVADLPMAAGRLLPVVSARLDGQPVFMLLETADESLSITRMTQGRLHLPEDTRHRTTLRGLGGTRTGFAVAIQRFEVGGVELPQPRAVVVDQLRHAVANPPIDGTIGASTLAGYDVEFDFRARHVFFWEREGCDSIAPNWTGTWSSAPLTRGTGSLMTLPVEVDGRPVRAVLSTGTWRTTIDSDAASRLGIGAADLAQAPVLISRGEDSSDIIERRVRVRDISVGAEHLPYPRVFVGRVHLPYADILLGAEFFQHRDVWISYSGQNIFIR